MPYSDGTWLWRAPRPIVERIDALALQLGLSRTDLMLTIVKRGLFGIRRWPGKVREQSARGYDLDRDISVLPTSSARTLPVPPKNAWQLELPPDAPEEDELSGLLAAFGEIP